MAAEKWVDKADHDLATAKSNFQQAVEKALKALYIKRFRKLIRTHDLYFLGKELNLPDNLLSICDTISSYYAETRYPDSYAEFDEAKVSKAISDSEKVIEWVKKSL